MTCCLSFQKQKVLQERILLKLLLCCATVPQPTQLTKQGEVEQVELCPERKVTGN